MVNDPYDPLTGVKLHWTAASGANNYRVERRDPGVGYHYAGNSSTTNFTDSNAQSGHAYLYRVCAADGSNVCTSHFSNVTLATAYKFDDDPLVTMADDPTGATATPVRA